MGLDLPVVTVRELCISTTCYADFTAEFGENRTFIAYLKVAPFLSNRVFMKFFVFLLGLAAVSVPALAQVSLSPGTYRVEGACSATFMKGIRTPPVCDNFVGIDAKNPAKPMFIFPLMNADRGWFFVTTTSTASPSDRAVYQVDKVYDQAMGAEFFYPSGECEISSRTSIRCSVWKDKERTDLARQVVFSSSGQWLHQD